MDIPQTVSDLLDEGVDVRKLRGVGFTANDGTIEQRNLHAARIELSQKMRVSDEIKGDAA